MFWAEIMVCTDFWADISLAFFFRLPTVGMAMSIRMAMIAITISNSIRVKPLLRAWRCARQRTFFMGMWCPRGSGPPEADPSDKIVQRIDGEGKWNAQRRGTSIRIKTMRGTNQNWLHKW